MAHTPSSPFNRVRFPAVQSPMPPSSAVLRVQLAMALALGTACGRNPANASPTASSGSVAAPPAAGGAQGGDFTVSGDPRGAGGARWSYRAVEGGTTFALDGVLLAPRGAGPFPAVVISHGRGGSPELYAARLGATMVGFGLVAIAPRYTHAVVDAGAPVGGEGSSAANVARAHKTAQLLGCLGYVDSTRLAAHGHSMGAFVTGELLGTYPALFRVASHTAGGASPQPSAVATRSATAQRIVTPYQLHHGDADQVVGLAAAQELDRILSASGIPHELRVYRGYDHDDVPFDPGVLDAVRAWYARHGLF
jgi:dienelactone hydrolase